MSISPAIDRAIAHFLSYSDETKPIRVVTGMLPAVRFARTDGLVDGGTIDHVSELHDARRDLHATLDPQNWRH